MSTLIKAKIIVVGNKTARCWLFLKIFGYCRNIDPTRTVTVEAATKVGEFRAPSEKHKALFLQLRSQKFEKVVTFWKKQESNRGFEFFTNLFWMVYACGMWGPLQCAPQSGSLSIIGVALVLIILQKSCYRNSSNFIVILSQFIYVIKWRIFEASL